MSTLIYCKNPVAATPFYIEEASLNVYSLEELSYFMLNNVYLLSKKFMSIELCNWISRDLKLKKLGEELLNLVNTNAPLHIFVGHILSANGYASQKEIKDCLAIIATFENKSEAECKKMRADRLMEKNKIVDAIYEYESLLSEEIAKTLSKSVEGDIYHNLGVAFAKLFFFDEASRCFDNAYKLNMKKQSLYCLLYSFRCKQDKKGFDEAVNKYHVPKETISDILNIVNTLVKKPEIIDFGTNLNDLANLEDDSLLEANIEACFEKWKLEYSKCCRI